MDNYTSEEEINEVNFKVLEVINSGSCFELPIKTLEKIKCIIKEKGIETLFLESHWCYKNKVKDMREYFEIPIIFKIRVESFDYKFKTVEELKEHFDSPCIMVGIK